MSEPGQENFRHFLAKKLDKDHVKLLVKSELTTAIHAVSGMMRFADYDNPLLLEALGDLLGNSEQDPNDAKQLGARAYLAASDQMKEESSRSKYKELSSFVLLFQTIPGVKEDDHESRVAFVEAEFRQEQQEAKIWYANLREQEIQWIASGADVEAEFDKLYTSEPAIETKYSGRTSRLTKIWREIVDVIEVALQCMLGIGLYAVLAVLVLKWKDACRK